MNRRVKFLAKRKVVILFLFVIAISMKLNGISVCTPTVEWNAWFYFFIYVLKGLLLSSLTLHAKRCSIDVNSVLSSMWLQELKNLTWSISKLNISSSYTIVFVSKNWALTSCPTTTANATRRHLQITKNREEKKKSNLPEVIVELPMEVDSKELSDLGRSKLEYHCVSDRPTETDRPTKSG